MKTNLLKTIAIVIFSGCFSFITHAQNVNGKIWVRIENQKIVPTLNPVSGNLESSDLEFNSLIQNLNVVSVEKALPSSRKASLLNVYEISSNSTSVDLYTAAVNSVKSFSAI